MKPPWWGRPYWFLAGAAVGLGIVSVLTIGIPLLLLGMLMAIVGALSPRLRTPSAGMALLGAAAAPGLLAWMNRDGPGTVCRALDGMTTCSQRYAPWPFLAVACALAVAGCLVTFRSSLSRGTRREAVFMRRTDQPSVAQPTLDSSSHTQNSR